MRQPIDLAHRVELLGVAGAPQRDADAGLVEHPAQRQSAMHAPCRSARARAGRAARPPAHIARGAARGISDRSRRRSSPANVVVGIHASRPGGRGRASHRTSTVMPCSRQYGSTSASIARSNRLYGGCAVCERRGGAEQVHLGRIEIAHADRADLAGAIEPRQRLGGLVDRHQRIGPVHLVEIDHVGR